MRRLAPVAAVLALLATTTSAQDFPEIEAPRSGFIVDQEIVISVDPGRPGPVLWRGGIERSRTDFIRFRLRVEGEAPPPETRLLLSAPLGVTDEMRLAAVGADGAWSVLLPFGEVELALLGDSLPEGTRVTIDAILEHAGGGVLFSTHGDNDLIPVHDSAVPEEVRRLGTAVAWLSFVDASGRPGNCTGFLVSPNTLLTNEHCINDATSCDTLSVVFDFEIGPDGRQQIGPQRRCAGIEFENVNFTLDATAIRLDRALGDDRVPLVLSDDAKGPEGSLVVIQHPGQSVPKQVSIIDCAAVAHRLDARGVATDFTHTCDTATGSSGSPILNAAGQVVGLHHFGFEDAPDSTWSENRAVHADLIRDWIAGLPDADDNPQ